MIAIIVPKKHQVHMMIRSMGLKHIKNYKEFQLYKTKAQKEVVLIESGTGREKAELITERIIEEFNPKLIISAGYSEGVKSTVKSTQLLLCKNLYLLNDVPAAWSPKDFEGPIKSDETILDSISKDLDQFGMEHTLVDCLSLPCPVSQVELKNWLGVNFPVEIVDICAYTIGDIAIRHKIPFLILRTALFNLDERKPKFVSKIFESNSDRGIIKTIPYIITNPVRILELIRLSKQSKKNQEPLSKALEKVLVFLKDSGEKLDDC